MRAAEFPEAEFPAVDSDAHPQFCAGKSKGFGECLTPGAPATLDCTRGEQCLSRMVFVPNGEVEDGHDGVPDGLVEKSVAFPDGAGAFVVESIQQLRNCL